MTFTSDVSMFAESNKAQIWLKALRLVFDSLLLIHYQVAYWRTAPSAKTTSIRVRKMTHTQRWTTFFDRSVQKYFLKSGSFFHFSFPLVTVSFCSVL